MYSKKDFGFSADFLKTVASVMSKNRNMTVSEIQEKLDSDVWSADTPILEGKEALIYDRQLNRRISVNVISEAMDPVNKKALKKDFDDREDKDIDNDGDTDDSDEYLHKRRKVISKAMKEESDVDEGFINLGGTKVKDDEKSILQHIKKTFPNVKKVKKDSQHGWIPVFEANKDLEEGKKGYKKESDDSSNDEKMTDAQKNDMNGDGDKDKKNEKKKNREKVDSIDTDPEMSDTMVQERAGEKLASYEREKLDDLKKKHEGGKMHRALRRQYGDKGDEIFYGKLTKMAKGEYDGSQSKSEELQLTSEDLNTLDELQRLGQQFDEARGRPPKGDDADDAGSKNFVMQMRKSVSLRGQNTVTFDDGSKMKVDQRKAQTFLNRFMDLKKPAEKEMLMKSASKSPKHFDMALQGKVAKDSKPSMLPPLKSEK
jgi:hypothetical protein